MYSVSFIPVSMLLILQKEPSFGLETAASSPRETTLRARAPRPSRRLQRRCTSSLLDSTTHADTAWAHVESCIGARRRMLPAVTVASLAVELRAGRRELRRRAPCRPP